jgi:hypothetical protein
MKQAMTWSLLLSICIACLAPAGCNASADSCLPALATLPTICPDGAFAYASTAAS